MEGVEERLAGDGWVGEIARVAEIGREVVAAPKAGTPLAKGVVPPEHEVAGVGLVAKFAAGGRADVVTHDGAEGDEIDVAGGSGAEAEIDVLAAVDEFFVEAAEFFPKCAAN
jgi:hypothetical protein